MNDYGDGGDVTDVNDATSLVHDCTVADDTIIMEAVCTCAT